jgi:hypothetical protein
VGEQLGDGALLAAGGEARRGGGARVREVRGDNLL